jgi:hypothetical protein
LAILRLKSSSNILEKAMSSVKQTARAQQVLDGLAERWAKARRSPANCRLGLESRRRRGGACTACTAPQDSELDQAVTQLINAGAFKRTGVCPYQIVASHLVAGLTFGPDISRARSAGRARIDPVVKIKGALGRIRPVVRATGLTREEIESLSDKDDRWKALYAVVSAERALETALAWFQSQVAVETGRSRGGRTGALHIQAVARALAGAWHALTGRLPAKDNAKFHDLLGAAVATIFGHPGKEPRWESATRLAVERINKDAARRS